MTNKITVYSKDNCINCEQTLEMMDALEIEYTEIKIADDDMEFREQMRAKGYKWFPFVSVNDWEDSWSGFQPDKIDKYSEEF